VPGDVDEAEADVPQIEEREAEVNGDAAALLFLEAVGVCPGQGLYQRGFPVVNVAGRADDDVLGAIGQEMIPRKTMLAEQGSGGQTPIGAD
jgi:hypothetical protein